jgi:hypothetical protein
MWDNIAPGRVIITEPMAPRGTGKNCQPNDRWDDRVPAVFVHDGVVYDVRARYAGSGYNRKLGAGRIAWTNPLGAPTGPSPLLALSWNLKFPRYQNFEGKRSSLYLSKLAQACPGVNWLVETQLLKEAGVPANDLRFVRFYVNGSYYHFMMDKGAMDEDLIRPRWPDEPIGELFKADGNTSTFDNGPFAPANGLPVNAYCGFSARVRAERTYERKTNPWNGIDPILELIAGVEKARNSGVAAMSAFTAANFDVEQTLNYLAIRNWAGAWDDGIHNYFLYRRNNGRWTLLPDDLDWEMGAFRKYDGNVSFYMGELNDPANNHHPSTVPTPTQGEWWNAFKHVLIAGQRPAFVRRLRELDKTTLAPERVLALIDEAATKISFSDWKASPAGVSCDATKAIAGMKAYVTARHDALAKLPNP